jgi:oligopeptide/dipeptide ABC transporter ATP-binding protein
MKNPSIRIENLKTIYFDAARGPFAAIDGVSFDVQEREMVGVVGESGCGKTTLGLSILKLIPSAQGIIAGGRIEFEGRDLLSLTESEIRSIRGNRISMIFQNPQSSLNPVFTVGDQISEAIRLHQRLNSADVRKATRQILTEVGIPHAEKCVTQFPHQLSGGMQQRVMIAIALSCRPKLLIADEPTTSLDVTIQAQIMELVSRLRGSLEMGVILITHNLGLVAEYCDYIVVMYAGKMVEKSAVESLFANPLHPYTKGLLGSIPSLIEERDRLYSLQGVVPQLSEHFVGCRFRTRCELASERCATQEPPMEEVSNGHHVACWNHP